MLFSIGNNNNMIKITFLVIDKCLTKVKNSIIGLTKYIEIKRNENPLHGSNSSSGFELL